MSQKKTSRMFRGAVVSCVGGALLLVAASQAAPPRAGVREPVHRVANAKVDPAAQQPAHPLDPALDMARDGLVRIRRDVKDYTCTLIKRERIKGDLNDYEYMFCKFRNRRVQDGQIVVPFSVYMYFLKPEAIKSREVVYVEGQNNNKLCAHEGSKSWLPTVWLKPTHRLAMQGQLYPIYDAGLENLIVKLIERGTQERRFPDCTVTFQKNAKVNGRVCTVMNIMHPNRRPQYEFHKAQIFIDDELQLPIRYAAYDWPAAGETADRVLEEYTYINLKLNVGLTDADFDTKNPNYGF